MALSTGGNIGHLPRSYFCYQCSSNVGYLLSDFTCPQCRSGFVEENASATRSPSNQRSQTAASDFDLSHRSLSRDSQRAPIHGFIDSVLNMLRNDTIQVRFDELPSRTRRSEEEPEDLDRMLSQFGRLDDMIARLVSQLSLSGPQPATPQQLSLLSVMAYTPRSLDDVQQQCCVCLEQCEIGDMVTKLACSHMFHNPCIMEWLRQSGTCPVCRQSLPSSDDVTNAGAGSGNNALQSPAEDFLTAPSASVETMSQELPQINVNVAAAGTAVSDDVPTLSPYIRDVEQYESDTCYL